MDKSILTSVPALHKAGVGGVLAAFLVLLTTNPPVAVQCLLILAITALLGLVSIMITTAVVLRGWTIRIEHRVE
jgi:hypothetical protein